MSNKWLQNDSFLCWRFFRTEEDQVRWDTFIRENPETKADIEEAIQLLISVKMNDYTLLVEDRQYIYGKIRLQTDRKLRNRRIRLCVAVAAAAAAGLALFVYLSGEHAVPPATVPENMQAAVTDSLVSEKDIRLLTADSQTMRFEQDADIRYDAEGKVVVSAGNTQVAAREIEIGKEEVRLNKLIVPYGKRSSLTLEDGTSVWMK